MLKPWNAPGGASEPTGDKARRTSLRHVVPGTAAPTAQAPIAGIPHRTVARCARIAVVPTNLEPGPGSADHVVQAKPVRGKGSDRHRRSDTLAVLAPSAVGIAHFDLLAAGKHAPHCRGVPSAVRAGPPHLQMDTRSADRVRVADAAASRLTLAGAHAKTTLNQPRICAWSQLFGALLGRAHILVSSETSWPPGSTEIL